jgi:hypothetical protein
MITSPIVLVLGAGVSHPFGFPLGIRLRQQIITDLLDEKAEYVRQLQSIGHGADEIAAFRDALKYSGKESVDAFLEHRTDYMDIGKAAIAQALIRYEFHGELFENLEKNLYFYLYKQLNATPSEFSGNKLSVVTFNYDRSLEQFLFTALQNSYNLTDDKTAHLLSAVPIIHLHGHMGVLPWQGSGGRGYGRDMTPNNLKIARRSIKIIHEAVENDPEFQQAYTLLGQAKRVVFLGFGYDKTNLGRLKINFTDKTTEFYGSCFGFSGLEKDRLIKDCSSNISLGMPTDDALTFLREFVALTG